MESIPKVVKVSGGRSSAYMLMLELESRSLDAHRGDVVIFNNTGCEHPETYAFVERLTDEAERRGIPFLWTEFVTFEEKRSGAYYRKPTYRLVKPKPYHRIHQPDGYHTDGSPFEAAISWRAFLPNRWTRSCTSHLKVMVTALALSDWFTAEANTASQGHDEPESGLTLDTLYARHVKAGGGLDFETLSRYKAFMLAQPHRRPGQVYSDYSKVGKVHRLNQPPLEFVGLTGIRADEKKRLARLRGMQSDIEERIACPLADAGVNRAKVNAYWRARPRLSLGLPEDAELSNCVFCPLKGARALTAIAKVQPKDTGTPSSLGWWVDLERRYQRFHLKETFGQVDRCASGFFGEYLMDDPAGAHYGNIERAPVDASSPCHCTD